MRTSRTHQHADMPSDGELTRLIEDKFPAHRELYLDLHKLVLEAVPAIRYSVDCEDGAIGYGARQFGYDGWGMAAVTPYAGWVSVGFLKGTTLEDPDGLLQGTGALVRHVKLKSAEELSVKRESLRRLLEAASQIDQE